MSTISFSRSTLQECPFYVDMHITPESRQIQLWTQKPTGQNAIQNLAIRVLGGQCWGLVNHLQLEKATQSEPLIIPIPQVSGVDKIYISEEVVGVLNRPFKPTDNDIQYHVKII